MPSVMPDATAAPANPWREALGLGASGPAEAGGASFQAILTGETELAEPAGRPSPAEKPAGEADQAFIPSVAIPSVAQPALQPAVQVPATLLGLPHDGERSGLEIATVAITDGGDRSIGKAPADEQGKQGKAADHTSEAVQTASIQPPVVLLALPTIASAISTHAVPDVEDSAPDSSAPKTTSLLQSGLRDVPSLPSALPNFGQGVAASDWIGEAITPAAIATAGLRAAPSGQSESEPETALAIPSAPVLRDALPHAIAPITAELTGPRTVVPPPMYAANNAQAISETATSSSDQIFPATPGFDSKIIDFSVIQAAQRSDAQAAGFPLTFAHSLTHGSPGASFAAPASSDGAAVPLSGVAVEIASRASNGDSRFEIRLDPPELGRIDVRLDLGRDGSVSSRLVVERAETLDLLRRDAGNLERALQSAGLNTSGSGLEFSLRDGSAHQRASLENFTKADVLIVPDDDVAVTEAVRRAYGVLRGMGRGVDMRV